LKTNAGKAAKCQETGCKQNNVEEREKAIGPATERKTAENKLLNNGSARGSDVGKNENRVYFPDT